MKNSIAISLLLAVLASSCSSDFSVNAPYKDVQVTYGVLNQQDAVHYVKINKAFLGDANSDAETIAKLADSSDYGDILEVKIIESNNPSVNPQREFILEDTIIENKDSGAFYYPTQRVYKFTANPALHQDATYKIIIKNTTSGLTNTAFTGLVNEFFIDRPSSVSTQMSFSNTTLAVTDYTLEWKSPKDARRFNIRMIFNYREELNSVTTYKTVEFNFGDVKSRGIGGGESMNYKILGEQFYTTIENAVPPLEAGMNRYIDSLDVYFYVAGEELNTYMEVNEPSTGIVQEKPAYTNFDNGIGIFSSRYVKTATGNTVTDPTARLLKNGAFNKATRFTHYLTNNAGYYPITN